MGEHVEHARGDSAREEIIRIAREDGRFAPDALFFMFEALDYTLRRMESPRHVTGQELLEGVRSLMLERFGLLSSLVLERWGVDSTGDFGRIVFLLIEHGKMAKTDEDSIDDFQDQYDFDDAFGSAEAVEFGIDSD